jgi:hypothetical protein
MVESCSLLWRGDTRRAQEIAARGLARAEIDGTVRVLLASTVLLTQVLLADRPVIESTLHDSTTEAMRGEWRERTRRGEHWFATYEVVRAFAVAALDDTEQARRDVAAVVAPLSGDRLAGVDADFLGVFAWACLLDGDTERARTLLDDTFWMARSPVTMNLIYEVVGRLHGHTGPEALPWRIDEVNRRVAALRGTPGGDDRARRMLDDELARLGYGS